MDISIDDCNEFCKIICCCACNQWYCFKKIKPIDNGYILAILVIIFVLGWMWYYPIAFFVSIHFFVFVVVDLIIKQHKSDLQS